MYAKFKVHKNKESYVGTLLNLLLCKQFAGGYSTYQKWLTVFLILPQLPTSMIVLSPIFTGASNVPILCPENYQDNGSTDACTRALNCTLDSENFQFVSVVQEVKVFRIFYSLNNFVARYILF